MLRSQDSVGVEKFRSEPRAETTKQRSRNAILLVVAVHAGMGRQRRIVPQSLNPKDERMSKTKNMYADAKTWNPFKGCAFACT